MMGCSKKENAPSAGAAATSATAGPVTLSVSCGAVGKSYTLCKEGVEGWSKKTGNKVKLVSTPNSATEMLALFQQLLAAKADDIDVFQVDVIWPGILGHHFIDLRPWSQGVEKDHFPACIKNNTYKGRLVAMPWFTDAGILYYRKDLLAQHHLEVPQSWQELTQTALTIQQAARQSGNAQLWGYVWQGKAYEGLTCNGLEWIYSFDRTPIVDEKGEVKVNTPGARAALERARGWIGTISPEGVLNYTEEEARGVFQSGNAVFMRNWPYAWALAQSSDSPVKDKVGIAPLPKGTPEGVHSGTLGGWQLAVSRYSKHPRQAADLVFYLTSRQEQKRRAISGSLLPTIRQLYQDPQVLKANPFFATMAQTLDQAVARPSTPTGALYNLVSSEFFNAVHAVLTGKKKSTEALVELQGKLVQLRRRGRW
jgi:trehalose/maltose transport system substrate-binding protein